MRKGSHHSPATREKLRVANKGKSSPLKGKPSPLKGTSRSSVTIEKIRAAHLGKSLFERGHTEDCQCCICKVRCAETFPFLGHHHSSATKEKMRAAHLGIHPSVETLKKMRQANLGKHLSLETLKKMQGENHHNWQGGISNLPYPMSWTEQLKESIRKRDKYSCQLCGKKQEDLLEKLQKKLSVHHIDYDKKNLDPENLISLCRSCHMKTNHKRKAWIDYFKESRR